MNKIIKSVMIIVIAVFLVGCSSNKEQESVLFSDYVNVSSSVSKYTPVMSSVPGLPIDVIVTGEHPDYRISFESEKGEMIVMEGSKIEELGKNYQADYVDQNIYWRPDLESQTESDWIHIHVFDDKGRLITADTFPIVQSSDGFYSLLLDNNFEVNAEDQGETEENQAEENESNYQEEIKTLKDEKTSLEDRITQLELDNEVLDMELTDTQDMLLSVMNETQDYLNTYVLTDKLTIKEVLNLHFEAMEKEAYQLFKATLSFEKMTTYPIQMVFGVNKLDVLDMEVIQPSEGDLAIESALSDGYLISDISVIAVAYEASYEPSISNNRDGVKIWQYTLVRENNQSSWKIYGWDMDYPYPETIMMLEAYPDAVETIDTMAIIGEIDEVTYYEELIDIYNTYPIDGAMAESFSFKLYQLYLSDELEGFWPVVDSLNTSGIDTFAMFLTNEMHYIEGFENIKRICHDAKNKYDNEAVSAFSDAVDHWILTFDD